MAIVWTNFTILHVSLSKPLVSAGTTNKLPSVRTGTMSFENVVSEPHEINSQQLREERVCKRGHCSGATIASCGVY